MFSIPNYELILTDIYYLYPAKNPLIQFLRMESPKSIFFPNININFSLRGKKKNKCQKKKK